MSKVSETPFVASLTFRGYAFAWFYDSELAMACANELLKAGLIQGINVYPSSAFNGFDITFLHDQSQWQYLCVHDHGFFINYHRSIRVTEAKMIGAILDKTIKHFKK